MLTNCWDLKEIKHFGICYDIVIEFREVMCQKRTSETDASVVRCFNYKANIQIQTIFIMYWQQNRNKVRQTTNQCKGKIHKNTKQGLKQ